MKRRIAKTVLPVVRGAGPTAVQISGLGVIAFGLFLLAPWLGVLAAGVALCLVGWALDGE